jgi:hypothetical protein
MEDAAGHDGGTAHRWSVVVRAELTEDAGNAEELQAELEDWTRQHAAGRWSYGGSSTDAVRGVTDEFFYFEQEADARRFAAAFEGLVVDTQGLN